jgi:hypothetical protein
LESMEERLRRSHLFFLLPEIAAPLQMRCLGGRAARAVAQFIQVTAIAMILSPTAVSAQPSTQESASQTRSDTAAEQAHVEGFRSAHWGMTDTQVKAAIRKDFNIAPENVQTQENASERTTVLAVTVNDLLEGAGAARISYILGFTSKKLIQVNVVWGTSIDPQATTERLVAAANQLRSLFLTSGYQPDTVVSNVASADGTIVVFQGQDSEKHMTLLRLASAPEVAHPAAKGGKPAKPSTHVTLSLAYILDPRNPDIYKLQKGLF